MEPSNYFVCKRVAIQTLLWSLELMIQISLEHDTIALCNIPLHFLNADEKVTVAFEINKDSVKIDPYCCAAKAMTGNPAKLATVGHILREYVFSTEYRPSPILAGGLEIPLMLSFKST